VIYCPLKQITNSMPINHDAVKYRINEILDCISNLKRLVSKPYTELSIDEKNSIRYYIIVMVEALTTLCIHVCREQYGYKPQSYSEAVKFLCDKLGIEPLENVFSLIKLRNLIVHRYWIIDDYRIYKNVKENFDEILLFVKLLEEKLKSENHILQS